MFVDGQFIKRKQRTPVHPGPRGVRAYVKKKCLDGYTMFSTAFGDTEYLIDMNGMVVHTWPVTHSQYAELQPNGHIVAGNYGSGVEEIDVSGRRVWSWQGNYHHDFQVLDGGRVVLLIHHDRPPRLPYYPEGEAPPAMMSPVALCVDRSGKVLWEFDFQDHIPEICALSGLPQPVLPIREIHGGSTPRDNWAHCNTIEVLPDNPAGRRDERFRAGNILFSFRNLDIVGVADVEKNEVVWCWGLGTLDGQHQPTMTDAGTIVIFDNGTERGYSAVVEVDPTTDREVWRYEDRGVFYSRARAGVQRLPNGNTLVAESDAGRLFELTPEKEIVWEYLNPFLSQRAGSQGLHIYRATRYAPERIEPILKARSGERVTAAVDDDMNPLGTYDAAVRYYHKAIDR